MDLCVLMKEPNDRANQCLWHRGGEGEPYREKPSPYGVEHPGQNDGTWRDRGKSQQDEGQQREWWDFPVHSTPIWFKFKIQFVSSVVLGFSVVLIFWTVISFALCLGFLFLPWMENEGDGFSAFFLGLEVAGEKEEGEGEGAQERLPHLGMDIWLLVQERNLKHINVGGEGAKLQNTTGESPISPKQMVSSNN